MRVIKRYSNRKLYDTKESRYVTLPQLAAVIRNGEDVAVLDNTTETNLTAQTLAQIISEEEKQGNRLPVSALHRLIREGAPA